MAKRLTITPKTYARVESYLRDTTFSVALMAQHTGFSEETIRGMANAMSVTLRGRS
jgi:hypothetical protein